MIEDGIPSQIGRYEIDRLLGAGAMGYVFLGRDPELDRPVAIKTVRDLKMAEDALSTFLERFRNEARAAARLHHPNIVQVYDVGEEPEVGPYLVFEYVAGSTLKQILKRQGALTPAQVVRLANEIADALTIAHDAEIIHRDIKPDNLLVTPDGQTKLADFGIARIPNASLTREGQFLGTPCYAAPETLGKGLYGPHSDLFSFAAMLYEAISGARAFPGQDAVGVAHKVLHDDPLPLRAAADEPSQVPKSVETVIMRGLDKDPDRRFPDAATFAEALTGAYLDAGLVRPEDTARPPSRRISLATDEPPRRSWPIWVAVLGTIGIGVALVFAFDDGGGPVEDAPDGSLVVDAGLDAPEVFDAGVLVDAGEPDVGLDGGPEEVIDTGPPDTGSVAELTPHEREEAAKDALDRARAALIDGEAELARQALDEARRYDPGNPNIRELEAELRALGSDEPSAPDPTDPE